MENQKIYEFIIKELSNFNFTAYTKGYRFLKEAIFICIKEPDAIENLNKNVFPKIANQYFVNKKEIFKSPLFFNIYLFINDLMI